MLTRKRFVKPRLTGDANFDVAALANAIDVYLRSLEGKQSLTLDSATGLDNTPVGANAASTGAFTTLSASGLISANGGQIAFPATQNASAGANTLDDYEEADYTPAVTSSSGTITSVTGIGGSYTKIGRLVHVTVDATITTAGTGSGFLQFTLPFTPTKGAMGVGRETGAGSFTCAAQVNANNATLFVVKYDGSSAIATGNAIRASCIFAAS